ncbi:MAG: Na(+)/H(+) antiporter subunit B [Acidiferrobacterales bacterium]|nr:Na(+)/H(+) antiporter subunit B [Acidiferrobacterales bacterium]
MQQHLVLNLVAKILIPFIILFALYVQFHGDYGPGGGFQAGVIFGAGFILYGLIFGKDSAVRVVPQSLIYCMAAVGVLLYTIVGVAGMLLGGEFLNYSVLLSDPVAGQHVGILLIELGVGITVASVMICLFFSYANYRHPDNEQDAAQD